MLKRTSRSSDKSSPPAEPIGIVISRGSRNEEAPRFSAYVWGPVPDDLTTENAEDLVAVA